MIMQTSLSEAISQLRETFASIDLRAAVTQHDGAWRSILTCVRFSAREVATVQQRHRDLDSRFGQRKTSVFAILLDALPPSQIDLVIDSLSTGCLSLEGLTVTLSSNLAPETLKASRQRSCPNLLPWNDEVWPQFYYTCGSRSAAYNSDAVNLSVRRELGISSVAQAVSAFLEVAGSTDNSIDLSLAFDVPARVELRKMSRDCVDITVMVHSRLEGVRLSLSRIARQDNRLAEHHQVRLSTIGQEPPHVVLEGAVQLRPGNETDILTARITSDQMPELDEATSKASDLQPLSERNLLFACAGHFLDMDRFGQFLASPHTFPSKRVPQRPQEVFQRSVAQLLTFCGFQTIDLGRTDVLREPSTGVERASIDILALNRDLRIFILAACTIGHVKTLDVEALDHAKSLIKTKFPDARETFIPILFSAESLGAPAGAVLSPEGLRIIDATDLLHLQALVAAGHHERFISYLQSPFSSTFSEFLNA